MSYKYGIDFGTTNSSIAIHFLGDDEAEHTYVVEMKNTAPKVVLPSLIYTDGEDVWVGEDAENRCIESGVDSDDGLFIKKIKMALEEEGQDLEYEVNGYTMSVEDLIAKIFERLRLQAEKYVDELEIDVHGVVLGVPVEYDQIAKNVLTNALYKAGFYRSAREAAELTEFVSEPIAVAIHYGLDLKKDLTIMVFDFGGGTLDLAVVNLKKNIEDDILHPHETIAKARKTLGGEDLTKLFFRNSFCKSNKYGKEKICKAFGLGDRLTIDEMWDALLHMPEGIEFIKRIEECKRDLSKTSKYKFSYIGKNVALEEKPFYRDDFATAIEEELYEIDELIDECLEEGGIDDPYDIDKVILAGGSSLIPAVQDLLADKFGSTHVCAKIDEDDEFVKGFAKNKIQDSEVLTSIVRGLARVGYQNDKLIEDVVDCNFGVWDDQNDCFLPIIKKGVKVKDTEFSKLSFTGLSRTVACTNMDADSVEVQVYQSNLNGLKKLGTIGIPNPGGKKYKIYMTIESESGKLEVILYDVVKNGWIDDIPLNGRQFDIEQ